MTNFERIKQMSVEEFAKAFSGSIRENVIDCYRIDCKIDCDGCILNWLNQEVEE